MNKVVVVTVTYGNRWKFLSQVVNSVIDDSHLEKIIIVDNASVNKIEIENFAKKNNGKVSIIRNERNHGSAGGYFAGLRMAREISCDYVLVLDDDNAVEKGGIDIFLENFKKFPRNNVVLAGNRSDMGENASFFFSAPTEEEVEKSRKTFFEVFSFSKVNNFFRILSGRKNKEKQGSCPEIVPNKSFAFGGTILPIKAVLDAPLPDSKLFLYGDDIDYSWGVREAGYKTYVCVRPYIRDVDMTFTEGSHIEGLFAKDTPDYKVYFRLRNMVYLSSKYTKGFLDNCLLLLNMLVWFVGLYFIVFLRGKTNGILFKRSRLIFRAIKNGLSGNLSIPNNLELPGNAEVLF